MRITGRQIRQIIREELSRLQETRREDDDADDMEFYSGEEGGEEGEEGSGYEYLSDMPSTVQWVDGPVDHRWLNPRIEYYKKNFPVNMWPDLARDFEKMLSGNPVDPDVVDNYINADGTSRVSRQTVERLVKVLTQWSHRFAP